MAVELDRKICSRKLAQLQEEIAAQAQSAESTDDRDPGLAPFVESLSRKHELFERVLAETALDALDDAAFAALLETVFTARRRLPPALVGFEHDRLLSAIRDLLYGAGPLVERMQAFVDALPADSGKARRAAWDLGAEMLHFRDPERYPLMARWVWDLSTMSGGLREFIRGNDTMRDIPLDARPETFEGARLQLAEFLAEEGFYRDVPYLVDLLLAKAYADYVQQMAKGVGVFAAELGARNDPMEFVTKMLGIDPHRRRGQSRIRVPTVH
ncbi:MAG: hypothetical protein ACYC18_13450 [Gammaproteobacteria bacterium]|nr:hypothetical protein [Gammaproteobacteria bacterium]